MAVSVPGQLRQSVKSADVGAEKEARCRRQSSTAAPRAKLGMGADVERVPQFHASLKENSMSLGVLNNLPAMFAENNLNNTQAGLTKTLQQLSSGSQINSGADDAAGLSLVDGLAANSAALSPATTNATEG